MLYKTVFKRYELKYLLTTGQKEIILKAMRPYMSLDSYGITTIRNVYFDTDNYRLIRRSIEKPSYKEKIRIRSYATATDESDVFVELKKKFNSVVYKRRVPIKEAEAMKWLYTGKYPGNSTQISDEIDYFINFYGKLRPTVFLSYEREAYYTNEESDFRITFDENILCRKTELSLKSLPGGTRILEEGKVMMEIKCSGGIPLWLTEVLSKEKIFKTSFSKYGTAYQTIIFPELKEEKINA